MSSEFITMGYVAHAVDAAVFNESDNLNLGEQFLGGIALRYEPPAGSVGILRTLSPISLLIGLHPGFPQAVTLTAKKHGLCTILAKETEVRAVAEELKTFTGIQTSPLPTPYLTLDDFFFDRNAVIKDLSHYNGIIEKTALYRRQSRYQADNLMQAFDRALTTHNYSDVLARIAHIERFISNDNFLVDGLKRAVQDRSSARLTRVLRTQLVR
jgi:hypothetical protein